jgi:Fe2+ or Zn2+ uptake regulation protein
VLAYLRSSDAHPTAAQIHRDLDGESPALSLATVYRNLEVLVGEDLIREVPVPGRALRYDGNPDPHHHFLCDHCGAIVDVELPEPRGLRRRLLDRYALEARRVSIDFHGLCPACEAHAGDEPSGAEPARSARRNH